MSVQGMIDGVEEVERLHPDVARGSLAITKCPEQWSTSRESATDSGSSAVVSEESCSNNGESWITRVHSSQNTSGKGE